MKQHINTALTLIFITGITTAYGAENASNPLASVNNTDVRLQYYDLDGPDRWNFWAADGAYMLTPKLKLKYEVHYWSTDLTGSRENELESVHLKPIYFPKQGTIGSWKYKLAVGGELILDFGHDDKGIGSGSDQIAPLVGLALVPREGTVLIPLLQHFEGFNGEDFSTTALRLIGIEALPNNYWFKLDAIIPVDWENDNEIPATVELQFGKNFSPSFGAYAEGLFGVGGDRSYDWGFGIGVRFIY